MDRFLMLVRVLRDYARKSGACLRRRRERYGL